MASPMVAPRVDAEALLYRAMIREGFRPVLAGAEAIKAAARPTRATGSAKAHRNGKAGAHGRAR